MSEFEPKMVGILCNWCSYAGADLAGVSRYQYPTNIRVLRVMCSTRVTPNMLLEMFKSGVDGVLVGGCHIGDCHYITGNYYTEKRIALAQEPAEDGWPRARADATSTGSPLRRARGSLTWSPTSWRG